MPEVELKLQVPAERLAAVQRALERGTTQRVHLKALCFDTPSWQLAEAGLALRLRREARVWVQTLKGAGEGPISRLEDNQALCAIGKLPKFLR